MSWVGLFCRLNLNATDKLGKKARLYLIFMTVSDTDRYDSIDFGMQVPVLRCTLDCHLVNIVWKLFHTLESVVEEDVQQWSTLSSVSDKSHLTNKTVCHYNNYYCDIVPCCHMLIKTGIDFFDWIQVYLVYENAGPGIRIYCIEW